MEPGAFLDLNFIPRYLGSSKKKFSPGERHVTRFGTQNVLLLVLNGVLCFEEDGRQITLRRGEYYVQMMGKHQSGEQISQEPEYIFLNFTGRFTQKQERSLPLSGRFDVERIESLYQRLKACEAALGQREDLSLLFDRQVCFFDILNALYKKSVCLAQKQTVATGIYEYINLHFAKKITLSQLSKEFGYSRDHLIRLFKSTYLVTPYQHLAYCRICHAKLLLGSEEISVSEIASACGYSDYTSFYHAFLRAEGISPSAFRREATERIPGSFKIQNQSQHQSYGGTES